MTATKTKTTKSERYDNIARLVVMESMDFDEAGVQSGLKASYVRSNGYQVIKRNETYQKAIKKYQQKLYKTSAINVQRIQDNAIRCLEDCITEDGTINEKQAYLKANEQLGRTIAAFVDATITETREVQPFKPGEREILSGLAKQYLESQFSENPVIEAEIEDLTEGTENE